jgi:hypothetical protein
MKTDELKERAMNTWTVNPMRRADARFALFGACGQYHGAFADCSLAEAYVAAVAETPAWIGDGYKIIQFR